MKALCYGYDNAAKNLFPPIVEELGKRGHAPISWPPQVRGVATANMEELYDCDIGLLNLASFQTQEELVPFAVLIALGKPVIVIADVPGAECRRKARPFASKASGLITPLEAGRTAAVNLGYRQDRIRCIIPPHWGNLYRQMVSMDMIAIGAARENRLTTRQGEGKLTPDDVLVYVAGNKDPLIVNSMLRLTIETGTALLGNRFVLGFAPHPGEKPEKPEDEGLFNQAFAERAELLKGVNQTNIRDLSNPERYAVAGLIVTSGGPNETIAGAYARNDQMLYYFDENVAAWMAEAGYEDGRWFVAELGAMQKVGPGSFADGFHSLFTDGRARIRAMQKKHFPVPETWDTAPAIVDFLEEVAAG